MSRKQFAALALAAATLATAGCGGSSKSSSQTTSVAQTGTTTTQTGTSTSATTTAANSGPVTKAQLVADANAICKRIRTRLKRNKFHSQQEIAQVAPGIAAFERGALAEMERLVPPPALANDWRQITTGIRTLASDAQKIGEYAKRNALETPAGDAFVSTTGEHGKHAAIIANRDGMKLCALAV